VKYFIGSLVALNAATDGYLRSHRRLRRVVSLFLVGLTLLSGYWTYYWTHIAEKNWFSGPTNSANLAIVMFLLNSVPIALAVGASTLALALTGLVSDVGGPNSDAKWVWRFVLSTSAVLAVAGFLALCGASWFEGRFNSVDLPAMSASERAETAIINLSPRDKALVLATINHDAGVTDTHSRSVMQVVRTFAVLPSSYRSELESFLRRGLLSDLRRHR
jgi:hypothetical protein